MSAETWALVLVSLANALIVAGATMYATRQKIGAPEGFRFHKFIKDNGQRILSAGIAMAVSLYIVYLGVQKAFGDDIAITFGGFAEITYGCLWVFGVLAYFSSLLRSSR